MIKCQIWVTEAIALQVILRQTMRCSDATENLLFRKSQELCSSLAGFGSEQWTGRETKQINNVKHGHMKCYCE